MKNLLVIICLFLSFSIMAQVDTISFSIEMESYDSVARVRLNNLFIKGRSRLEKPNSFILISSKYNLKELETVSIPIFALNKKAAKYKCGENMEYFIAFKEDPFAQVVFIVNEGKKVGEFNIIDSFIEANRIRDSINNNNPFHLHGNPILIDYKKVHKGLVKYKNRNPDVFVFMIKGIHGYWAIKKGSLIKLDGGLFRSIREKNANATFCKYGAEYIKDIGNDSFKTGHPYILCDCSKLFEEIHIQVKQN